MKSASERKLFVKELNLEIPVEKNTFKKHCSDVIALEIMCVARASESKGTLVFGATSRVALPQTQLQMLWEILDSETVSSVAYFTAGVFN